MLMMLSKLVPDVDLESWFHSFPTPYINEESDYETVTCACHNLGMLTYARLLRDSLRVINSQ